ncbi:DUF3822 family protein [Mucilaginibacter limnophilus]|uniref:DUF3822 family protein n=1 Tax=Mucilaginibacter limnophilus TaxID=1932778 RepID=A0A437MYN6_9SPHI|nr:DUF3822 family protein [Mucilaginibacter limnophilus]RVU02774.1 DUF3822 family protein [Mucilaginibacter limnophilus]
MNEPVYYYTNDAIDLQQAGSYTLLLKLNTSTFAYAVAQSNSLIEWGGINPIAELTNPADIAELLSAEYRQVIVGLPSVAYTLIPEAIFSEANVNDFVRFLDVQPGEKVFIQQLDSENRVLYKVSADVINAIEKYGVENTVFGLKGWVKAIAGSNPSDDTIYAEISGSKVSFLYYNYGKLRFLSTFDFYTPDELSYYAAFVTEQLKMQPKKTRVCISGEISRNDDEFKRLADFFNEVETTNLNLLQLPDEVEPHHILSVAALTLCG